MPSPHHTTSQSGLLDLFQAFFTSAHWVWERRATAKAAGFPFSEETVTETFLLDLATTCPHEVVVVPFNKRQEALIGADWEWCFYNSSTSQYTRMLVQAKVLDDKDILYSHLNRRIGNTHVRQIDRLISTARRRNVTPLYAFYNHVSNVSRLPLSSCPCWGCSDCWGISVALADAVAGVLPARTFDRISDISHPLLCLLCSRGTDRRPPLPSLILENIKALGRRPAAVFERGEFPGPDRIRLPDEPERLAPSYFAAAREVSRIEPGQRRDLMVAKISDENPGVDGVVLISDDQA